MKYRKNYLAKVIFQLRFDPVLKLRDAEPEQFQEQIKGRLPRCKIGKRIMLKGEIKPLADEGQPKTYMEVEDVEKFWTFSSDDKSVSLSISSSDFTLEYTEYEDVVALRGNFDYLWNKFQVVYNVKTLSRVGLRYINQINFPTGEPLDWKGYISDNIIKAVLGITVPDSHSLGRSMNTIFWQGDEHRIKFQLGIHNRDFPNPVAKKEFILDYDCFSIDSMAASEAKNCLIRYNELIGKAFEQSIDEKLRQDMEPIQND